MSLGETLVLNKVVELDVRQGSSGAMRIFFISRKHSRPNVREISS